MSTKGQRTKRSPAGRTGAARGARLGGAAGARAQAWTLRELRARAGKTQDDVATSSGVSQIEVSRAESRSDHRVSTLRRYVKALGGDLIVFARFGGRLIPLRDV
jgi:Helix-turn-helix domain